jgi:hypothetical protein
METKIDPCDTMRNNLIAAALGLEQCTQTDGTETLIPGTSKRILVGDDAYLARVVAPAAAEQPMTGDLRQAIEKALEGTHIEDGSVSAFDGVADNIEREVAAYIARQPAIAAPEGWRDRIYKTMDNAFLIADSKGKGADGALVIDDTQAGVEFAMDQIEAILAAPAIAARVVPEGFTLVPLNPTPEMIEAGNEVSDLYRMGKPELWGDVYRAMLRTAPQAPAAQEAVEPSVQAAPSSDLMTIRCPECVALPGLGCDECHGQGEIIVSRKDMAALKSGSTHTAGDVRDAAPGEPTSAKQEKLRALADRIDHDKLWRRPMMYRDQLTTEQQDRLDAGVMLRRYAELLAPGRWLVVPPKGNPRFSASTFEAVIEMVKRSADSAQGGGNA